LTTPLGGNSGRVADRNSQNSQLGCGSQVQTTAGLDVRVIHTSSPIVSGMPLWLPLRMAWRSTSEQLAHNILEEPDSCGLKWRFVCAEVVWKVRPRLLICSNTSCCLRHVADYTIISSVSSELDESDNAIRKPFWECSALLQICSAALVLQFHRRTHAMVPVVALINVTIPVRLAQLIFGGVTYKESGWLELRSPDESCCRRKRGSMTSDEMDTQ
jgi:hypothetical protein